MSPQVEAPEPHEDDAPAGRLLRNLEIAALALCVAFVLFATLGVYLFTVSRTLPDLDISEVTSAAPHASLVYARDGSVLGEWNGEQDRRVVALADVSEPMREAVVAIEDERFFTHDGVDWMGIVRAAHVDAGKGAYAQGGSTITQQLVKLLFTDGDRSLQRKVREAMLAYQLETKVDKQRVLEAYLNAVYFGSGAYGVESAAREYFGKSASELDVGEAAMLAGIIRSPVKYSPRADAAAARQRRDLVLRKMRDQGYLTPAEEAAARAVPVKLAPPRDAVPRAPYFVEYVKQDLISRLGAEAVYAGGLRVYTTLDPRLQQAAEDSARRTLGAKGDPDVAVVSVEPRTGGILAMVGGRDFAGDQFNLAVQGRRQPGSAFKPFVLVTALEKGYKPEQVMDARPYQVRVKDGVWKVDNYENAETSPTLTLRAATQWSVNCVYARLIMAIGPMNVVSTARAMGITSPLDPDPAIALGGLRVGVSPLEMASAYATLANAGVRVEPTGVARVTDAAGKLLYEPKRVSKRAIPAAVAATTSELLHEVVERGTGTSARTGRWAAGKTGTTQSYRDAWFIGWSEGVSTAVWVGHAKGQVPMTSVHGIKVTGGSFPAVIWSGVMANATSGRAVPTSTSAKLVLARICADSLQRAKKTCPNVVEMYLPADEVPATTCTRH